MSEKFWRNALGSNLVPIVFGPARHDIIAVAPPNSFIFAQDFETTRDLVQYLYYLDHNDTGGFQHIFSLTLSNTL